MNRVWVPASILVVLGMFALASEAIVRIKTAELSFQLARDQLFNYELSSRMLRERFASMIGSQDDYSREIKMNVLESGVLNFSEKDDRFSLGTVEQVGLVLVNAVRKLNLKRLLSLQQDQGTLVLLQYAFFLERTRNYKGAVEKYEKLEGKLRTSPIDHGFVLLHMGFCHALMGQVDPAIASLRNVQATYPGTRNADDASVLVELLIKARDRRKNIEQQYTTPEERAVALATAGQYSAALRAFAAVSNPRIASRYYRARSLEGVGRTNDAVAEYVLLVKQQESRPIAVLANRRLLMIGNFYRGGEAVKKIAEDNARKIGDDVALKEVQKGKELQLKPKVIERIRQQAQGGAPGKADQELVQQLEDLRKDLSASMKDQEKVTAVVLTAAPIIEAPRVLPLRIRVRFLDGREVYGDSVATEGNFVVVNSGKYQIRLPYTMVASLEAQGGPGRAGLRLLMKGGKERVGTSVRRTGDTVRVKEGTEEVEYPDDQLHSAQAITR